MRNWKLVMRQLARCGICLTGIYAAFAVLMAAQAAAQSPPRPEQDPLILSVPADVEMLRKERFRRQAAETAQKQLERLADQLREQLVAEVAARKAAEAALNNTISKIKLTDELDAERKRLRDGKVVALQKRRDNLERENLRLSQLLNEETVKRQQLAARLEQVLNSGKEPRLHARVMDLERALNAARWARKLAEAQLELVAERLKKKSSP